mmetsp:Transcript_53823/g.131920  ORF Transcript_53823/g.131920 Transcript_53823/m.131920 type:complete len:301 (-) Transcript_53823:232-1134(-)
MAAARAAAPLAMSASSVLLPLPPPPPLLPLLLLGAPRADSGIRANAARICPASDCSLALCSASFFRAASSSFVSTFRNAGALRMSRSSCDKLACGTGGGGGFSPSPTLTPPPPPPPLLSLLEVAAVGKRFPPPPSVGGGGGGGGGGRPSAQAIISVTFAALSLSSSSVCRAASSRVAFDDTVAPLSSTVYANCCRSCANTLVGTALANTCFSTSKPVWCQNTSFSMARRSLSTARIDGRDCGPCAQHRSISFHTLSKHASAICSGRGMRCPFTVFITTCRSFLMSGHGICRVMISQHTMA